MISFMIYYLRLHKEIWKNITGGIWNCSGVSFMVKRVFWVLQFWETTSISSRKNTCRDLLGKRCCQKGCMINELKDKQKYILIHEWNCPWLGVHFIASFCTIPYVRLCASMCVQILLTWKWYYIFFSYKIAFRSPYSTLFFTWNFPDNALLSAFL